MMGRLSHHAQDLLTDGGTKLGRKEVFSGGLKEVDFFLWLTCDGFTGEGRLCHACWSQTEPSWALEDPLASQQQAGRAD